MFVGTAPLFKEEFQRKVHFGGTIVAGLGTTLWLFWLEMALFASAYTGLLVKMMFG